MPSFSESSLTVMPSAMVISRSMGGGSNASRAARTPGADVPLPDPRRGGGRRASRLGRVAAAGIGRQRRRLGAQRRSRMHRRVRGRAVHRAARGPLGPPGPPGPRIKRLARTHRTGINRTAGHRTRRARGRHSGTRQRGSAGRRGRLREPRHHVRPRRHHRPRRGLTGKIRFRGRTQRTASTDRRRGASCRSAGRAGSAGGRWRAASECSERTGGRADAARRGTVRGCACAGTPAEAAFGSSPSPAGSGCRGPERICPGLRTAEPVCAGIAEPARPAAAATVDRMRPAAAWPQRMRAVAERHAASASAASGCAGQRRRSGCSGRCAAAQAPAATSLIGCRLRASARSGLGLRRRGLRRATAPTARRAPASGACVSGCFDARDARRRSPPATRRRTCRATSSSSELECVFLSATPSSGNSSRITFGLTSSSRASSLMRILLIRCAPWRIDFRARGSDGSPLLASGTSVRFRMLRVLYRNRFVFRLRCSWRCLPRLRLGAASAGGRFSRGCLRPALPPSSSNWP